MRKLIALFAVLATLACGAGKGAKPAPVTTTAQPAKPNLANIGKLCDFIDEHTVDQLNGKTDKSKALVYAEMSGIPDDLQKTVENALQNSLTSDGKTLIILHCIRSNWGR